MALDGIPDDEYAWTLAPMLFIGAAFLAPRLGVVRDTPGFHLVVRVVATLLAVNALTLYWGRRHVLAFPWGSGNETITAKEAAACVPWIVSIVVTLAYSLCPAEIITLMGWRVPPAEAEPEAAPAPRRRRRGRRA
ncbi:hypothetical protein ACP4OV_005500 [Aristida adscensionis]